MMNSTTIKQKNLLHSGGFYFKLLVLATALLVFVYPLVESFIIRKAIVSAKTALGVEMPPGVEESTSLKSTDGTVLQLIDRSTNTKISIALSNQSQSFIDRFLKAQYDNKRAFGRTTVNVAGIQGESFKSKHKEHLFIGKFIYKEKPAAIAVVRVDKEVDIKRLEEVAVKLGLTSQR